MEKFGVYEKVRQVIEELRKEGIAKAKTAGFGKTSYAFRGIDDVYNALSGILAEKGLLVIPSAILNKTVDKIEREEGKFSFHTVLEVEFKMIDPVDGSYFTGVGCGEATDTGDKSIGKAQSYAYKSFVLQAFCIPTEGDNDTENNNEENKESKIRTIKTLTDERFSNALKSIAEGRFSKEKLIEDYILTDAQLKNLNEFMASLSSKDNS